MEPTLNYAMGYMEDLIDQACYLQTQPGWEIESQLLFNEAKDLATAIDNGEDILTMKLLSEFI